MLLIVCICTGKIVRNHGEDSTTIPNQGNLLPFKLKRFVTTIFIAGMFMVVDQAQIMT